MNYGFEGKNIVISGGTGGIGMAAAAAFLRDKAKHVFLLGRSEKRGEQAISKLLQTVEGAVSENLQYIKCDLRKKEDCEKAVQTAAKVAGGGIDVLINCAGVYRENMLSDVSEDEYAEIMDINVKGTVFLTRALLPFLPEGASVINIASDAGIAGNYGCCIYAASKGAVVAFTKSLALDLAPKIRVNCICPADVDTPLLDEQLRNNVNGCRKEDMGFNYPLKKIAVPEEIAHVILSTASPANSFMTGSIITVDGGITL